MKDSIGMYTEVVKFYPYRKARMVHQQIFLTLDRNSEMMKELENQLAEKADVFKDNHTAYMLRNKDGNELYIQFTDGEVNIGSAIIEESW